MTLKQIAEELNLPESTVRLYRDEFELFVPVTGEGRRRRYESGGLEALKKIVDWKRQGWSATSIRQELARTTTPQEKRKATTQDERIAEMAAAMQFQSGEIALLRAEVGALRAELSRLVSFLEQQQNTEPTLEAIQRERLRQRAFMVASGERT